MNDKNPAPLPGIDMVDALTRLGGNRALLERVYVDFCRQYADAAGELGRLAASGALSDAAAMAHAVKGVAGNIGAVRLSSTAASAMQLSNFQYPKEWRRSVQQLREQLEKARSTLKASAITTTRDESRPELRS